LGVLSLFVASRDITTTALLLLLLLLLPVCMIIRA
jgi:hypothetical protein